MGDPKAALRVELYGCPPCKPPVTTSQPETAATETLPTTQRTTEKVTTEESTTAATTETRPKPTTVYTEGTTSATTLPRISKPILHYQLLCFCSISFCEICP